MTDVPKLTPYEKNKLREARQRAEHEAKMKGYRVENALDIGVLEGENRVLTRQIVAAKARMVAMGHTPPPSASDPEARALEIEAFARQVRADHGGKAFVLLIPYGEEGSADFELLRDFLQEREWSVVYGQDSDGKTDVKRRATLFEEDADAVQFSMQWDWFVPNT